MTNPILIAVKFRRECKKLAPLPQPKNQDLRLAILLRQSELVLSDLIVKQQKRSNRK